MTIKPRLRSTTEVWTFEPSVRCTNLDNPDADVLIRALHLTETPDGNVHLATKGILLTTKGIPRANETVDYRRVSEEDLQQLHVAVLRARDDAQRGRRKDIETVLTFVDDVADTDEDTLMAAAARLRATITP